jgi:hypothetical protein
MCILVYRFGIRSVPPCPDCWEDGQCSMNCGPAVKPPAPGKRPLEKTVAVDATNTRK